MHASGRQDHLKVLESIWKDLNPDWTDLISMIASWAGNDWRLNWLTVDNIQWVRQSSMEYISGLMTEFES
jgi:hypothetical protein